MRTAWRISSNTLFLKNITEVMYACGFSNPTSFSTVFKKFYGVSPRDYMKEHSDR